MSTQSGIAVSDELQQAFAEAQTTDVRALKVVIANESLIPSSTTPMTSSDVMDFDKIPQLLEPENTPAYILVKLDNAGSQETQWLLATYVPDNAQVRLKMLYSSTKSTLSRQLGDGKFLYTMFASVKDELSAAGFKRFFAHQTSSAPLTEREKEMADIRTAEGVETQTAGTSVRRSHAGVQLGMVWSDEVEDAVAQFSSGKKRVIQLGIDTHEECVTLQSASDQLSVPDGEPSYTFYASQHGKVFIYCCPDKSPIRGRMIYSSNAQPVAQGMQKRGVQIIKKIETSDPSEITETFIDAEFAQQQAEETGRSTTPSSAAAGFARPTRPGKKR